MADFCLPEGCYFRPTEHDAINYLRRRKNKQPQPYNFVLEFDVYGNDVKHPSELFHGTNSTEIYCFTTLKESKNCPSRIQRTAGGGTWKEQKSEKVFDPNHNDGKRVIGQKTLFSFLVKKGSKPSSGRYIMHEYSLPEKEKYPDVLCKIRFEDKTKKVEPGRDELRQGKKRIWDYDKEDADRDEQSKRIRLQFDSVNEVWQPVYSEEQSMNASSEYKNYESLESSSAAFEDKNFPNNGEVSSMPVCPAVQDMNFSNHIEVSPLPEYSAVQDVNSPGYEMFTVDELVFPESSHASSQLEGRDAGVLQWVEEVLMSLDDLNEGINSGGCINL